jgi:phosphinothricin acetyltransferase
MTLVRNATVADIPAIAKIYAHHVLHGLASFEEVPPDEAEMQRRFEDVKARGLPYFVAEAEGAVRGYAYASPFRLRTAYRFTVEDSVYLHHDWHRRGLGRLLLNAVVEACTAKGMRQMIAVIGDSGNDGSIGLHKACGFRMSGTFHSTGFKFGRWVDSVMMQRALGPGDSSLPG